MPTITGTAGNDHLIGNETNELIEGLGGTDTLDGGTGNDTLDGGADDDSMIGGAGNDVYHVQQSGDTVVETVAGAAGGIDTVYSHLAGYTLGVNVENVRIMSIGAANATGNGLANVLYAGAGDNVLDGAGGNDTASYAYATAGVNVSLAVAGAQNTVGSGSDTLVRIENLTGSKFGDTLAGNSANNRLVGGAGLDTVSYAAAGAAVTVSLALQTQQNTGGAGVDTLKGIERLVGSVHNDSLSGGAGRDTLDGGAGNDTLSGGKGNDTYTVNTSNDVISEAANAGYDTVYSSGSAYALADNVEMLVLASALAANGTGNAGDNVIVAGSGNNVIDGGDGFDIASYQNATAGVTVSLGAGGPQATGSSGSDTLLGIEGLRGSAHNDSLSGNDGDNQLAGGNGTDTLAGGKGNDAYLLGAGDGSDVITETLSQQDGGGIDTVYSSLADYTLGDNLENLWVKTANGSAHGNALDNVLTGNGSDNLLDGADGLDTASYRDATGALTVDLSIAGAQATGGAGNDTLVSIENLQGGSGADSLSGNAGENVLDGGIGGDTLSGGAGDDTYVVDSTTDVLVEAQNQGYDTVRITESLAWTLGAHFEIVEIANDASADVTGNSDSNSFYLGAGNETINGAGGSDHVSYRDAPNGVSIDLTLGTASGWGNDVLLDIENAWGSEFDDNIVGNAAANRFSGWGGDDTMAGAAGDDFYFKDAGDSVIELAGQGTDTVLVYDSWTMGDNIEICEIGTSANINITGNAGANTIKSGTGSNVIDGAGGTDTASYLSVGAVNVSLAIAGAQATGGGGTDTLVNIENLTGSWYDDTLTGSSGANVLDGFWGNDSMVGGAGNDTYKVNTSGDVVVEASAGGTDTVMASLNYTLPANVEHLQIIAANNGSDDFNGTGNNLDNTIYSNAGNNVMNGMGGINTASYFYASSGVNVSLGIAGAQNTGGAGTDTLSNFLKLSGSVYNDTLTGGNYGETINGLSGDDRIAGKAGVDTLYGFWGSDTFVFDTALSAINNVDTIADFNSGEDRIEIDNAIFTVFSARGAVVGAGNLRFGTDAADSNDFLVYDSSTGKLYYDADGSGIGAKVWFATLDAGETLAYTDFVIG